MERCKECNASLDRVDPDSESLAALGIYWLTCPNGHEDPLKKQNQKKWRVRYSTERGSFSPTMIVTAASEAEARQIVYDDRGDICIEAVELLP